MAGLTGEALDLPSAQFDAALSTWTLCTIPNVDAALAEIRRVLRPGATFHLVEHGHAPDPDVARWQRTIEPPWKHLIERAGFHLDRLGTYYVHGEPKVFGYTHEGLATKA